MNELIGIGHPEFGMTGIPGMNGVGTMGSMGAQTQSTNAPNEIGLDDETMALLRQLAVEDPGAYQQMMSELGLPPEMFMPAGGAVQAGQPTGVSNPQDQRSDMTWQALLSSPVESNVSPIVDKVARNLGLYDNSSDTAVVGIDPYNQGEQLDDSIMQLLGGGAY